MEFQEKAKPVDRSTIGSAAGQLFRAMDGLGTDEKTIHRILAGKTGAELAALRTTYADHYFGRSLDDDLRGELSGSDLQEAQAALSGDPIEQAAAALQNAANGVGTDEQKIHDTLAQIDALTRIDPLTGKARDPAACEKLRIAFQRRAGRSLDEMLRDELSGSELRISEKELLGDRASADALRLDAAMHGGFLGLGTDEQRVNEVLEHVKDKSARDALLAAYQAQTGRSLSFDLMSELSGVDLELSQALIADGVFAKDAGARRDAMAQIAASRLAIASQGIGTDEEAIFMQFEGVKDPQLRLEIKRSFDQHYGRKRGGRDYADMITEELSGNDLERAIQVARDGQMDPAFALKYAMDGVATDEELIRATLKRCKTAQEIYALKNKYAALHGSRDTDLLENDLDAELSGRDGFEIRQLLRGAATENLSVREQFGFANRAYDFERGTRAGILGNAVTDRFSNSGQVLDMQHHRLQALEEKWRIGSATAEELTRLSTFTEYHKQDVQNCQAARDAITNSGALLGTGLLGTAVTLGTWGTSTPALLAALGALGSGATEIGLRLAMQGDGYATEDLAADLIKSLVSAATAGLVAPPIAQVSSRAAYLRQSAPRLARVVDDALRGGQSGFLNGTASSLLDERTFRGKEAGGVSFFRQLAKPAEQGSFAWHCRVLSTVNRKSAQKLFVKFS